MREHTILKNDLKSKKELFDKLRISNGLVSKEKLITINENEAISNSDDQKSSFIKKIKNVFKSN